MWYNVRKILQRGNFMMKRIKLFLLLVLTFIFCCACGSEANGTVEEENLSDLVTIVDEYFYEDTIPYTHHVYVIKNNSSKTVNVSANVIAKDASGQVIGASTDSADTIASGTEALIYSVFQNVSGATAFTYTMSVEETKHYEPVTQDLSVEYSTANGKVIVMCTNNGQEDAGNLVAQGLFFKDGRFVDFDRVFFVEVIKPGVMVAEELLPEEEFDDIKIFMSGWR